MRYLTLLLCFLLSTLSYSFNLKANAPSRYVVQPGDTLWTIANRYLVCPWEWKALWQANPGIKNPDHIYAGEILILDQYQNAPYIKVLPNGTVKLSPAIRASSFQIPIPSIPLEILRPFLNESLMLDYDILRKAPYVIDFAGERMVGGQGDEVYVKGLHPCRDLPPGENLAYSVYRAGKKYFDPITNECLGFKATLISHGELIAGGEPATLLLTNIVVGVHKEDKVLTNNSTEFALDFLPGAPSVPVHGLIIEMFGGNPDGNSQGAVGGVVMINKGALDGLKSGDVLGVYAALRTIKDPRDSFTPITLPAERVGEALIFKAFTRTSFALIVRSTQAVYLMDMVTNP